MKEAGIYAPMVGHVGDGNFHMMMVLDTSNRWEGRGGVRGIEGRHVCARRAGPHLTSPVLCAASRCFVITAIHDPFPPPLSSAHCVHA